MIMRTTLIRAAHCALVLSLILVCVGPLCRVAQPQILRWEVEATVVEFFDPDSIFPNVHLGDPVRGVISYDLATAPNNNDPNNTKYQHTTPFEVVEMAIDNPRDGSTISFVADPLRDRGVQVLNNWHDEFVGLYDNVFVLPGDPEARWLHRPFADGRRRPVRTSRNHRRHQLTRDLGS